MVSRAFCGPIDRGSEGATEGEIFKAAFPPLLTLPEFPLTRLTSGHLRLRPHDRAEVYPSPAEGLRARAWARRRGPPPCPRTELDSVGPRPASPSRPGTRGPPHAAGWLRGSCPGSAPGCACPTEAPGRAACRADPLPTAPRGSRVRRRHRDRADTFQPVHLRPASRAHALTRTRAHTRTLPGCPPGSRAAPRATCKPRPRPGSAAPKRALLKWLRLGIYCTENEDEQFEKHFFIR